MLMAQLLPDSYITPTNNENMFVCICKHFIYKLRFT